MSASNTAGRQALSRKMKKCPECFTLVPVDDKVCTACNSKIGKIGADGVAKRPVDWMSYVKAILMWVLFCVYIWWAFLQEK